MKKFMFAVAFIFAVMAALAAEHFSPFGMSFLSAHRSDRQIPRSSEGVYGWRLALFSGAHRHMIGLATAVFANDDASVNGYVGGLQTAVLFNTAGNGEFGASQISGFYNGVSGDCNGVQISVFCNKVNGYFTGVQTSLFNWAESDSAGAQVGLVNNGGSVYGLQIGLINHADSLKGIQLGLFNCVDQSRMSMSPIIRVGW